MSIMDKLTARFGEYQLETISKSWCVVAVHGFLGFVDIFPRSSDAEQHAVQSDWLGCVELSILVAMRRKSAES